MISLSDGLSTIELPPDLHWQDELWSPVAQQTEYTIGGAMVVEPAAKLAGRPVTLVGDDKHSWIRRETLEALLSFAAMPGQVFTLTLHDKTFSVMMRHQDTAIEAEPIFPAIPLAGNHWYNNFTLRLMII